MKNKENILNHEEREELIMSIMNFCYDTDCDYCDIAKKGMCCTGYWEELKAGQLLEVASCVANINTAPLNDDTKIMIEEINKKEEVFKTTNPSHYKTNLYECIDEMELVFGIDALMDFCKLNAWKYRYRSDNKDKQGDLAKADWYINKLYELQRKKSSLKGVFTENE